MLVLGKNEYITSKIFIPNVIMFAKVCLKCNNLSKIKN